MSEKKEEKTKEEEEAEPSTGVKLTEAEPSTGVKLKTRIGGEDSQDLQPERFGSAKRRRLTYNNKGNTGLPTKYRSGKKRGKLSAAARERAESRQELLDAGYSYQEIKHFEAVAKAHEGEKRRKVAGASSEATEPSDSVESDCELSPCTEASECDWGGESSETAGKKRKAKKALKQKREKKEKKENNEKKEKKAKKG